MQYPALFEPAEEGGFVITFPDFGWGVSQADDEQEALDMAVAMLQTLVQEHIRKGEPLPPARHSRGRKYRGIQLPLMQGAKAELYAAFRDAGIRKAEFGRRLGIPKTNVDRLFDLRHHTRLDQMEAAFRVLGKEIGFQVRNAA